MLSGESEETETEIERQRQRDDDGVVVSRATNPSARAALSVSVISRGWGSCEARRGSLEERTRTKREGRRRGGEEERNERALSRERQRERERVNDGGGSSWWYSLASPTLPHCLIYMQMSFISRY